TKNYNYIGGSYCYYYIYWVQFTLLLLLNSFFEKVGFPTN
ncbi:MAG: hypothetical protein ACI9EK_003006, partial [Psychroserpens sp.]